MDRSDNGGFAIIIIAAALLFSASQAWDLKFSTLLEVVAGTIYVGIPCGVVLAAGLYFLDGWRAQVLWIVLGFTLVLLGPVWLPAIQESHGITPPSEFLRGLAIHGDSFWESWLGRHLMELVGILMIVLGIVTGIRKRSY